MNNIILFCVVFSVGIFTVRWSDMPATNYKQAEEACTSLGSHVSSFDYSGDAECENSASINYKKFIVSKINK